MATSPKQKLLDAYDREHATTMRLLREYPKEKSELKPNDKLRSARELAFVFVMESRLGMKVWHDELAKGIPPGSTPPKAPESWDALLSGIETAYKEFRGLISSASDESLNEAVHFMVGPKKMGEISRFDWAWFLINDQIHHRGQFSIYSRLAGGKVPAIYGPSADEPWI